MDLYLDGKYSESAEKFESILASGLHGDDVCLRCNVAACYFGKAFCVSPIMSNLTVQS
jgi:hypothetical protein